MRPVIISAAITGAIHTPSMSDYLPVTPDDIAAQAIDAARAGAAVVHIHARHPENGAPSSDMAHFRAIAAKIKSETDAVICTTTGGGLTMGIEERIAVVPELKPELASCNMGSINFALFPMAGKKTDWKHAWEQPMLAGSKDFIFKNTFADLEVATRTMAENGTKPEFEVYDVGHLHNLDFIIKAGWVKPPVYLQFVLGILGGISASIDSLVTLRQTADRILGADQYQFSGFGAGRMQYPICTTNILMGGHCRVGLEDSLFIGPGELAQSNAQQVEKMVRIVKELNLAPATPDQAREILGLKGGDQVHF